ncbi:hypothetical protein ACOSQ2_004323 [Xanthoceras sorbifolium]
MQLSPNSYSHLNSLYLTFRRHETNFLTHKDLLEYEHEVDGHEKEDWRIREELKAAKRKAQAYKEELASKTEVEKKLVEDVKRCRAITDKLK